MIAGIAVTRLRKAYKRDGLAGASLIVLRLTWYVLVVFPTNSVSASLQRRISRPAFTFMGSLLSYFVHGYNRTWTNERIIEIPIIRHLLAVRSLSSVLEVGNVMNYYHPFLHDVIDKYEIAPNVINIDACDFCPSAPYDVIFSISTLEHIGWDPPEKKDGGKIERVIRHLVSLLAPDGVLIFTAPTGYNPYLDDMLANHSIHLTQEAYMERVSSTNEWAPTSRETALSRRYGSVFPAANGIVVGVVTRASEHKI